MMNIVATIVPSVIAVGGYLYLKVRSGKKNIRVDAKIVDCIKYWDLFDYYKSPEVQRKLSGNKHLKLFAQREEKVLEGRQMTIITMAFFDSEKEDVVPLDKPLCLASEKLDDMLRDKFGNKTMLYMRDEIL